MFQNVVDRNADNHNVFAHLWKETISATSHLFFRARRAHWQQPFLSLLDKLISLGDRGMERQKLRNHMLQGGT